MKTDLVSFCLFAYNQEAFIEEAVKSALAQEYDNLEIIISDDCSSDGTFEIIQRLTNAYTGKHKLIVLKNECNMGLVPHINEVLFNYTHGEYIILAAGDDVSLPQRTKLTVEAFKKNGVIGIVSPIVKIDKNGNFIEETQKKQECIYELSRSYLKNTSFMVYGTGLSFVRKVLEVFGELKKSCPTEDSTFRLRCLLLGKILLLNDNCMYYRIHGNNISSPFNIYKLKTQYIAEQYITDIETAFKINLISGEIYNRLLKKTNRYVKYRELCHFANDKSNFISKVRLYFYYLLYQFI